MPVRTQTKTFTSNDLITAVPPTGNSLEEQVNTFLKTLTPGDVLDVIYNLSKNGKYGENPFLHRVRRLQGQRDTMKLIKGPWLCEHANENPNVCPCPKDCYCKTRTCESKMVDLRAELRRFLNSERLPQESGQ